MWPKRTASSTNSSDSRIANMSSARFLSSCTTESPLNRTRLTDPPGESVTVLLLIVAEYIPYVFQILAQMLMLHQGMPVDYHTLLPHLLTPAIWAQKGSIPGLVALLRTFFAHDTTAMVKANQHMLVLGIVQQRLVLSKTNDRWGFELLQSIVLHVPLCVPFFWLAVLTLTE